MIDCYTVALGECKKHKLGIFGDISRVPFAANKKKAFSGKAENIIYINFLASGHKIERFHKNFPKLVWK